MAPNGSFAQGSVTANIGRYVVSILQLHDQPSCNIDITWPVESRLWVDRMYSLLLVDFCPELLFSILVSILNDWHFM